MYERVDFPVLPDRPYFFTNFVSTLDGKVDAPARHAEYWPIGSEADHAALVNLRVNADALVHGRGTAMMHRTVDSLAKAEFAAARRARGKARGLLYIVVSDNPDEALRKQLANTAGIQPFIVGGGDLAALARDLKNKGVDAALVEGGPHLAASFFAAGLIDEIFLTLAPKVFGGGTGPDGAAQTITMAEGPLLPPAQTGNWKLLAAVPVGDEVFLRYRR
jgi:riboflavin biosynthesis pyrimidine reductase